jgi:hypothetical protein
MKPKPALLMAASIILFCFAAWLILSPKKELIYRGKPLSEWLLESQGSTAFENGFNDLLQDKHVEIVPHLIQELNRKGGFLMNPYMWLRAKAPMPLANRMPVWADPAPVRARAAYWLGTLGPQAHDALPSIIKMALHDTVSANREAAITALVQLGIQSTESFNALISALSADPIAQVRRRAAGALEIWKPNQPEVIPALIRALSDSDEIVRAVSAATLGSFGPRARLAIPKLEDISTSNDSAADYARTALAHIKSE